MKAKDGYMTRPMGDCYIVVAIDDVEDEFNGLITLNKSGLFIWEQLQQEIEYEDLLRRLVDRYDAPEQVIKNDLDKFLKIAKEAKLIV